MSSDQKSYKKILKATSLFGGVQVIGLIAGMIRSKFAAVLIGVQGMGFLGVLNSALNLIVGVSKLGLDTSSIKEIAFANNVNNHKKVSKTVYVLRRLLWLFGVLGALLTIVLSPVLSQITFNSNAYVFSFIWLSVAVLFRQLTYGELSVLQGLRMLRRLALANVYGSVISVFIALPMYYFFGIKGVVPTIILSAFFAYLISRYFSVLLKNETTRLKFKQVISEGKPMLKLGVTLSVSNLITLLVAYVIQVYIANEGGIAQAGYYNAGIIIINSYVGIIFEAMGKDYFPRLSGLINDRVKIREAVTQQATVVVLLITPIIVCFLAFSNYIIVLLYSNDFKPITMFLNFAIIGIMFKAVSWSMGYVIIAHGHSKIYIKTAIGFNLLLIIMNIVGYHYYGLTGLGVSFVVYYFIHCMVIGVIMMIYYKFIFPLKFLKIYLIGFILVFATFLFGYLEYGALKILLLAVTIILSVLFTLYMLNKIINFKSILKSIF